MSSPVKFIDADRISSSDFIFLFGVMLLKNITPCVSFWYAEGYTFQKYRKMIYVCKLYVKNYPPRDFMIYIKLFFPALLVKNNVFGSRIVIYGIVMILSCDPQQFHLEDQCRTARNAWLGELSVTHFGGDVELPFIAYVHLLHGDDPTLDQVA